MNQLQYDNATSTKSKAFFQKISNDELERNNIRKLVYQKMESFYSNSSFFAG